MATARTSGRSSTRRSTSATSATNPADRAALLANGYLLVGFQAASGGTDSEAARIR
jgi:hypothetical protein